MSTIHFQEKYQITYLALQARLAERAWKDVMFKDLLLQDANAAIKEECSIDVSGDYDVEVLEATETYQPFVLPAIPESESGKTADEIVGLLTSDIGDQPAEVQTQLQIQAKLFAKAWTDDTFKEALVSHPAQVLHTEFGVPLSDDLKIETFEEDERRVYMVLPPNPDISNEELSDEQMDAVAGGGSIDWIRFSW